MLNFFRSMLKSKIGAAIALLILVVIALSFASGDIAGMHGSGANGGTTVATVGGKDIDAELLTQGAKRSLDRVREQTPTATMKLLVAQGGIEQVLDDIVERTALFVFGQKHGIVISDRLIDSEITQIPAFQGVDGKFDQATFRQVISRQGISEQALRDDFRQNLTAQQLLAAAQFGSDMSEFSARRYAALLEETRTGSVVALPSLAFAPAQAPTDAQLAAFYKAHTSAFIRPERRVIRYAAFGDDAIKNVPAPTDAEIAARFNANQAVYGAQDNRKITQLIVPTEAAAKAVAAEVAGGKSLEAAASEKGLSAASLEYFSKQQLSGQFSGAVADAVFAAPLGKLAAPQKSPLGWHVIRVDAEQKKPARTLAEAKDELSQQISVEKRRAALTDMLAKIEEQFSNGASLLDVARVIGAQIQQSPELTADGQVYMKPGEAASATLKPILATAFSMDQEEPQVAELERGKTFVIYDVPQIAASAPAPLAQIKDDVKLAWMLDAGSTAAKAAAIKMQGEIRKGKTLEQAIAAVGKPLPPIQQVAMSRPTLNAALRAGRQVPPPVSLMFHMAKNTVKVQAAAQDRGWFVVQLKDIVPGKVESAELVSGARKELGGQLGQAYAAALGQAIRKDVGVTKHAGAIKAVRDQLAGTAAAN